jgi:hypothetical protein
MADERLLPVVRCMSLSPTIVAILLVAVATDSHAASPPISVELGRPNSTGRAVFLEAVYMTARIHNSGAHAVAIRGVPHGSGLEFRDSQGSWQSCPGPDVSSPGTLEIVVSPSETRPLLLSVGDCAFALPEDRLGREGTIELRARITLSSGEKAFSTRQSLRLASPTGLDREAHAYLKRSKDFDGKEFLRRFGTSVYAGVWLASPEPSPDIAGQATRAARSFDPNDRGMTAQNAERERRVSAWLARNGSASFLGQRALVELAILQGGPGRFDSTPRDDASA